MEKIAEKNNLTVTFVVQEYVRQGLEADKIIMGIGKQAATKELGLQEAYLKRGAIIPFPGVTIPSVETKVV